LKKYLNFEIESAEVIEEDPNSQFATTRIQAFSSDVNRHELYCSEETLKETAPTIYNKPILYNIDKFFGDFGSHTDADKSLIAGFVVPDSAEFVRLPDSRLSLVVLGKIWKRYAPKVIQFFKESGGNKKISVEMELYDAAELPNGLTEMKNFAYFGICLLGDLITEASQGANAQILSFAEENAEYLKVYKQEFSSKYSELNLSIPETIKQNANKALSLYVDCETEVNGAVLAASRFISKNSVATPEKIRQIHKLLNNYSKKDLSEKTPPSSEYISYLALGGSEGHKWSSDLVEQIDEIDARKLSYFNASQDDNEKKEVETFMEDEKDKQEEVKEEEKKEEMAVDESKKEDEKDEKTEEMAAEENKEESKEEDKKEDEKDEKSFDFAELLNALNEETEEFQAFAAEIAKPETERNYSKAIAYMYSKMNAMKENCAKMSADKEDAEKKFAQAEEENKAYMAENEELKKFKSEIEGQRFQFAVESTIEEGLKKVPNMPKEEIDALREESKNYSMETVGIWKNLACAKFFTFTDGGEKKKDDGIVRFALPWNQNKKDTKESIWD
jgi:hypothetical protein